ncbi:hypothetical protein KC367_g231 [Hortaea werneckii]|nr:hypothetical protein KC367_g231 [Hortaea werneckii]
MGCNFVHRWDRETALPVSVSVSTSKPPSEPPSEPEPLTSTIPVSSPATSDPSTTPVSEPAPGSSTTSVWAFGFSSSSATPVSEPSGSSPSSASELFGFSSSSACEASGLSSSSASESSGFSSSSEFSSSPALSASPESSASSGFSFSCGSPLPSRSSFASGSSSSSSSVRSSESVWFKGSFSVLEPLLQPLARLDRGLGAFRKLLERPLDKFHVRFRSQCKHFFIVVDRPKPNFHWYTPILHRAAIRGQDSNSSSTSDGDSGSYSTSESSSLGASSMFSPVVLVWPLRYPEFFPDGSTILIVLSAFRRDLFPPLDWIVTHESIRRSSFVHDVIRSTPRAGDSANCTVVSRPSSSFAAWRARLPIPRHTVIIRVKSLWVRLASLVVIPFKGFHKPRASRSSPLATSALGTVVLSLRVPIARIVAFNTAVLNSTLASGRNATASHFRGRRQAVADVSIVPEATIDKDPS